MVSVSLTAFSACDKDIKKETPISNDTPKLDTGKNKVFLSQNEVFNSGSDGINSYRIPSLVTSKKGTLLLFCEARKLSWIDKSPTDIALKRSTDNGESWTKMQILALGGKGAFMDPCAIVDKITGRIYLFTTFWPENDHSGLVNTAWLMTSDDDGISWTEPQNVTTIIVAPNLYITGFGPGAGFQMTKSTMFPNRLILPTRQMDNNKSGKNRTVFSDDHGNTWKIGEKASNGGEFQIAESPKNVLVYNLRSGGNRLVARSIDGGVSWGSSYIDTNLPSVPRGCQASILGIDSILFYTGPSGGKPNDITDNRIKLKIYRSLDGGVTWKNQQLLNNRAAGYSCITQLHNGNLAIAFETADTEGFTRMAGDRPSGWMRLDVIILKKEIASKTFEF